MICCRCCAPTRLCVVVYVFVSMAGAFELTSTKQARAAVVAFRRFAPRLYAGSLPDEEGSNMNMTVAMEKIKTRLAVVEMDVEITKAAISRGVTNKEKLIEHITGTREQLTSLIHNSTQDLSREIAGLHVGDVRVRGEVARVYQNLSGTLGGLQKEIGAVNVKIDEKFVAVSTKIDEKVVGVNAKVDEKFVAVNAKIDEKFGAVNAKIDEKIDGVHAKIDEKIDGVNMKIDEKIDGVYKEFGAVSMKIDKKFDGVNAKIDFVQSEISKLAESVNSLRTEAKNETSQTSKRLDTRFNAFTILFVFFGTTTGMIMLANVIAVGKL
jgi:chromosome segregation ATPase